MKLEKAIEIKQLALDTGIVNDPDDYKEADMLSIEALKRLIDLRSSYLLWRDPLLPGETIE